MASDNNSSNNNSPFEWLSGGLFFGKNSKGGGDRIESIDSCKDVMTLINGMDENLKEICLGRGGGSSSSSPAGTGKGGEESQKTAAEGGDGGNQNDNIGNAEKFLEARSQRVRFLLYEERRTTSQQAEASSRRSSLPTVAGTTVQALTGNSLSHLIPRLLDNLGALPFESRKHVASIFNYLLVCGLEGTDGPLYHPIMSSFRDYIASRYDEIMSSLVKGHDCALLHGGQVDCALHFGTMMRSCLRHVPLYKELTITTERTKQYVFPFLDKYVHLPNFDVSSDAMETLRIIFTGRGDNDKHNNSNMNMSTAQDEQHQAQIVAMAELAANFLTRDYDEIWNQRFNPLLLQEKANYMTRRMALQILSTVLLTRSNYAIMIQYVAERKNLILVMKLLRDTSPHITLDAFHVFKVFVANPNKPPEIVKILKDNSMKLCRYLETLHKDREDSDTQFRDEKALIIATIEAL